MTDKTKNLMSKTPVPKKKRGRPKKVVETPVEKKTQAELDDTLPRSGLSISELRKGKSSKREKAKRGKPVGTITKKHKTLLNELRDGWNFSLVGEYISKYRDDEHLYHDLFDKIVGGEFTKEDWSMFRDIRTDQIKVLNKLISHSYPTLKSMDVSTGNSKPINFNINTGDPFSPTSKSAGIKSAAPPAPIPAALLDSTMQTMARAATGIPAEIEGETTITYTKKGQ